jgi:hypothetical protein
MKTENENRNTLVLFFRNFLLPYLSTFPNLFITNSVEIEGFGVVVKAKTFLLPVSVPKPPHSIPKEGVFIEMNEQNKRITRFWSVEINDQGCFQKSVSFEGKRTFSLLQKEPAKRKGYFTGNSTCTQSKREPI